MREQKYLSSLEY